MPAAKVCNLITVYHGMMIGLLAALEPEYEVRFNRESGDGRPDVLIKPRHKGEPGVVLELKSARKDQTTIEKAMADGLKQLDENDYAAELRVAGVEKIQQMVVAFNGKRVIVLPQGAKPPKKKGAAKKTSRDDVRKTKKSTNKKRSLRFTTASRATPNQPPRLPSSSAHLSAPTSVVGQSTLRHQEPTSEVTFELHAARRPDLASRPEHSAPTENRPPRLPSSSARHAAPTSAVGKSTLRHQEPTSEVTSRRRKVFVLTVEVTFER